MTTSVTPNSARLLVPDDLLVRGQRIAVGVHGCRAGSGNADVVLIHGTPSSSLIWRNVASVLVYAGHRVVALDLLGYGASERPHLASVDTSVSAQVPIILGVMEALETGSAHVVAHDIGGGIAQRLGILHPEWVRSIALLDVCSFESWPSRRTREQMQAGLEELIRAPAKKHREQFEDWLLSAVEDKKAMRDGPLKHFLDLISGPVGQASFFQHQVAHYDPRHTKDIAHRLHELGRVPVSVIWGAQDAWQEPYWAERLHAAIPGSCLTLVEGAGHFIMEDKPKEVSQLLLKHLEAATG